jgi:hypothetical protein
VSEHDEQPREPSRSVGQYPYIVEYAAREGVTRTDTADVGHNVDIGEIITLRSGEKMTVEDIEDHPRFGGRAGHIRVRRPAPERR